MQPSAAPDPVDLAHTHARPLHWLATATATAAVVALAGALAARAAEAGPATASASASAAPGPAAAPDADTADYPLRCGGAPHRVAQRATGDLDGDGKPETVAVVHCEAGSGTPPAGLYVLTRGRGDDASARVVATLVDPREQRSVTGLAIRDGAVRATLLGYSSPDVPSCCPDEKEQVGWDWTGGAFVRSAGAEARGA
ncbi:hypothetical protein [Streptomyces hydrogenans]|uniref:hypothetical protein n=1 Tax=Streptomyces hydrogenans TaxID=1873719 RepID=UPI00167D1EC3|nr:hypothetical protein [Streptomyces hydrogenans]GHG28972.1 hypothetical protein GCM10018784_47850 [Streptomyces hydrogenans]